LLTICYIYFMFDMSSLPPIFFRLINDPSGDEAPTPLDAATVENLIRRATDNLGEFLAILNDGTTPGSAGPDERDGDTEVSEPETNSGRRDPMKIEVTWDTGDMPISDETRTTVLALVSAGLIMTLKDFVAKHPSRTSEP
jgi:hypothetical protein